MSATLLMFLILYASVNIITSIGLMSDMYTGDEYPFSPVGIKKCYDYSWFGAIVTFICMFLFVTVLYVSCFIYFLIKKKWPQGFK